MYCPAAKVVILEMIIKDLKELFAVNICTMAIVKNPITFQTAVDEQYALFPSFVHS